jgi:hypothetical protein
MQQLKVEVTIKGLQNLQYAFNKFLTLHMNAVSGYFNAIIERGVVLKPTIGNGNCLKLLMIMGLQW